MDEKKPDFEQMRQEKTYLHISGITKGERADFSTMAKKLMLTQPEFLSELLRYYALNNKEAMKQIGEMKFVVAAPSFKNEFVAGEEARVDIDATLAAINAEVFDKDKVNDRLEYLYQRYLKNPRGAPARDREAVSAFIAKYRQFIKDREIAAKELKEKSQVI